MSKAFTREDDQGDSEEPSEPKLPTGVKNYITPNGFVRLKDELHNLLHKLRPEMAATVAWAAGNGDRSENADYIYGKRRLREIDRRIRFLNKRLEAAEIVDPSKIKSEQIFFGATVTIQEEDGTNKTYSIVGIDETDPGKGRISWISPISKALLKANLGDVVTLKSPKGIRELEIIEIRYESIL